MLQTNSPWTDEVVSQIKDLWALHSAGEIAEILGKQGISVSRNAVVGKLHRLGVTIDAKSKVHPQTRENGHARPKPARKPASEGSVGSMAFKVIHGIKARQASVETPWKPSEDASDTTGCLLIPFSDLETGDRKCRWPFASPPETEGPFVYCGVHTPEEIPYCARHARIAYQPPEKRRGVAA